MDCIFCKIIRKEIPSHTVYEDEHSLAFLDITASAPGHTMVILKKHGVSILDYSPDELGFAMGTVQIMAQKIQEVLKCESITIGINHLEPTGVKHLHIHLIPRFANDNGHALQGVVKNPPKESLEAIAEKLRVK